MRARVGSSLPGGWNLRVAHRALAAALQLGRASLHATPAYMLFTTCILKASGLFQAGPLIHLFNQCCSYPRAWVSCSAGLVSPQVTTSPACDQGLQCVAAGHALSALTQCFAEYKLHCMATP